MRGSEKEIRFGRKREGVLCAPEIALAAMGQRRQMRKKAFKQSRRHSAADAKQKRTLHMLSAHAHIHKYYCTQQRINANEVVKPLCSEFRAQ
jgi:hypothetical protein